MGDNSGCGAEAAELIEQRVVKHELLQRQVARVRCPANSAAMPCQLCSQTSAAVQGLHKLGSSHGWSSILELQLKQADCWAVTVPAAVTSPPVAAARILLSLLLCCLWLKALFPEKFEEACVIFTGVSTCEDFVEAEVLKCSSAAEKLGCSVGMRGADALELLR